MVAAQACNRREPQAARSRTRFSPRQIGRAGLSLSVPAGKAGRVARPHLELQLELEDHVVAEGIRLLRHRDREADLDAARWILGFDQAHDKLFGLPVDQFADLRIGLGPALHAANRADVAAVEQADELGDFLAAAAVLHAKVISMLDGTEPLQADRHGLQVEAVQPVVEVDVLHRIALEILVISPGPVEVGAVDHAGAAQVILQLVVGFDFNHAIGAGLQLGIDLRGRARIDERVGIGENQDLGRALAGTEIAGPAGVEGAAGLGEDNLHRRMALPYPVARLLRAGIVDHDHLGVRKGAELRQGLLQMLQASLAGRDDGVFHVAIAPPPRSAA